jgi:hypothetical protein
MIEAGIIPSGQRIKEYILESCDREDFTQLTEGITICIADILRIEEDRSLSTDAATRQMLVLLESGKQAAQLRKELARIKISEKEPQVVMD